MEYTYRCGVRIIWCRQPLQLPGKALSGSVAFEIVDKKAIKTTKREASRGVLATGGIDAFGDELHVSLRSSGTDTKLNSESMDSVLVTNGNDM